MKVLRPAVLLSVALLCGATLANSESLVRPVAGKNIELVIPDGFCVPDPSNAADANFINGLSTLLKNANNVLVQTFLSCADQKRRRASAAANIFDYVSYYYPTAVENVAADGPQNGLRKSLCEQIRKANLDTNKVQQSVAKSAEELRRNVAISSVKSLGVLAEDTHGCYSGILANVSAGKDNAYLVNCVIVATVIRGKYLFLGLYSKYADDDASAKSLKLAQSLAAELDAKNPN